MLRTSATAVKGLLQRARRSLGHPDGRPTGLLVLTLSGERICGITLILSQFARRGSAPRPAEMPLTTGGLEAHLSLIENSLKQRRYALRNRERTNRLLMLMQLHTNGNDSETAYRAAIRTWLEANGGRPRTPRRAVTDPLGAPSLRR